MPNRLRTALITLISLVWAINFSMPLFQHDYKPPAEINLAFMGVVGLLTAGYKGGDDKPPTPPAQAPPQYPPEPLITTPPRKRTPAKKVPAKKVAKKTVAKKTSTKKTTAKKTTKKTTPRKRGSG